MRAKKGKRRERNSNDRPEEKKKRAEAMVIREVEIRRRIGMGTGCKSGALSRPVH